MTRTRRAGLAAALLLLAALFGAGAAAAAAADEGAVTITVTVPDGGSPSPSPTPPPGNLPRTGPAVPAVLGAAAALIVVGAGLIALGRRSRKSPHHHPQAAFWPSRKERHL